MQIRGDCMHIFDYSFLAEGLIPADIVSAVSAISAFNSIESRLLNNNSNSFKQLENIARVQSVKSSNEIEGVVTTDARIQEIVAQNSAPLNHDEAEIAGYRDALNRIHTDFSRMSFNEQLILQLHSDLFHYTVAEDAGKYKTEDNLIIGIQPNGTRYVRFKPVAVKNTSDAMEQFFLAYSEAAGNVKISKLLLIPCVMMDFLCIHPFTDGNGRLSRLLTLMLLYKNGFDIGRYISFEQQISENKESYYSALQNSCAGWHENKSCYFDVIRHFVTVLYCCYKEFDKRFSLVDAKRVPKGKRIQEIILNSILPVSKAEICALLPDVSMTTVEAELGKLIKNGSIRKIGAARSTKYVNAKNCSG